MADNNMIEFLAVVNADEKSLQTMEKKIESTAEKTGEGFADKFSSSLQSNLKTKLIAAGAVIGSALFGKMSIDAAVEAERAVLNFNRALGRTGEFTKEASDSFIQFADSLELTTGLTAESVLDASAQIQNLSNLSVPQLQRATKATIDFARALNIDLQQAAIIVGKAANNQLSPLSKLGIQVEKGKTSAETFANVLTTLESRFGGASVAAINTFAGALVNFRNQITKIPEEFGKLTTSSPKLVALINALAGEFSRIANGITEFGKSSNIVDLVVQRFVALGGVIINFVVRPLELVGRIANFVFEAFRVSVQSVIAILGRLGGAVGTVLGAVGIISKETQANLQAFKDSSLQVLGEFEQGAITAFTNIGDASVTEGFKQSFARISEAVNAAGNKIDFIPEKLQQAVENSQQSVADFKSIFQSGIVNTVSSSFAALGGALAKGENGFKAFSDAAIKSLGAVAIQLGTMILTIGLGFGSIGIVLPTWAVAGAGAIVNGLALITLGGALQAAGGGGGGGPATTSISPNAITPPEPPSLEEDAVDGSRSRVTVNIQGDVLDTRDTGLRIVEILQEAFDTDGARVITA